MYLECLSKYVWLNIIQLLFFRNNIKANIKYRIKANIKYHMLNIRMPFLRWTISTCRYIGLRMRYTMWKSNMESLISFSFESQFVKRTTPHMSHNLWCWIYFSPMPMTTAMVVTNAKRNTTTMKKVLRPDRGWNRKNCQIVLVL